MATEINTAKLDKLVKAGKTQAQCANELGISPGQLGMLNFGQAQVRVGLLKKAPATAASVKALRDKQGLRWEFIAAATGLSVAKVREAYGDKESYIGRGRKPGASNGKPAAAKGKTAASKGKTPAKSKTPVRNKTRAGRAAASGNPS
jgi:hypothetical protein